MANSYYTSDDLISSIKRKSAFPISQNTFTANDIIAFINEEMVISQVPSVLSYHEEFFVTSLTLPILPNISRYPVPSRAIGQKLRSVYYKDTNGNLVDMTRISSDDKAYFQGNADTNQTVHKFYMEGNDVVLTPTVTASAAGSLVFFYYLRPNQLVTTDRVATIGNFYQDITLGTLVAGDTVVLNGTTFTAVVSGATGLQFNIGGTAILTANNLVVAINTAGTATATNSGTAVVHLVFNAASFTFSTNNTANVTIPTTMGMVTTNSQSATAVPTNFTVNSNIDFLQTGSGHKIRAYSIPIIGSTISGQNFIFPIASIPTDLVAGDYIASENECIIPMIPDDLHSGLAERTCARILAALGDQAGLQMSNAKIQEINSAQNMLLDNRTEGNPKKVLARHSILRYSKNRPFRRL